MRKINKVCFVIIITTLIISICTNVMAATGSLYNKYKDGGYGRYPGGLDALVEALKKERNDLSSQGILR